MLDVDVSPGGVVQSVGISTQSGGGNEIEFDYLVDIQNPVLFTDDNDPPVLADVLIDFDNPLVFFNTLLSVPGFELFAGSVVETLFPFNVSDTAGNELDLFAPQLLLDDASTGVNSGTGASLALTSPDFEFFGTGQNGSFDNAALSALLGGPGFPSQLNPYDPQQTFTGNPSEDESLTGVVRVVGDVLVVEGEFFSSGRNTGGMAQISQVHDGEFLAVTTDLPGDYNDDGMVSPADYTVWRDNVGAAEGTLPNDIDGGVIGSEQFETFVEFFGADPLPAAGFNLPPTTFNPALSTSAVSANQALATPEPSSFLLFSAGVSWIASRRRLP